MVSKKEARRLEAERKAAPIHMLLIINNMATQILYGLEGGKVLSGVAVPELILPKGQKTWCEQQLAKVIRWTAANLDRYGFQWGGRVANGLWDSGLEKIKLIGRAIDHYAPETSYHDSVIIQLIVAELVWSNICVDRDDQSREAKWLSQTLDTFTSKFTDGEDSLAVTATDIYMAICHKLDGSEAMTKEPFGPAWSAA